MNNKTLFKISLVLSFLGLSILVVAYVKIDPGSLEIGKISNDMMDERVKVSGSIKNINTHKHGHFFLDITDGTGEIKIVIWENIANRYKLMGHDISMSEEGDVIEVTGKITEYKSELEVIAEKFELL